MPINPQIQKSSPCNKQADKMIASENSKLNIKANNKYNAIVEKT